MSDLAIMTDFLPRLLIHVVYCRYEILLLTYAWPGPFTPFYNVWSTPGPRLTVRHSPVAHARLIQDWPTPA